MLVVMRDITTIKLYPQNPRHNDHAVDAVAASLREFGFRRPIVVDDDGVIVVGGTRYKAALKLGLLTVPVHVASGLTPARHASLFPIARAKSPLHSVESKKNERDYCEPSLLRLSRLSRRAVSLQTS
jgi:hypothetical protein